MEAPDKIYLQHNTTTDLYDEFWPEWFEGTHHPERDICYIRKDALMEWLENKMSLSYGVATDAFVEVIDKLNSL